MYADLVWQLLIVAVVVWNLGLSYLIWKDRGFLRSLFPRTKEREIRQRFEELLGDVAGFEKKLEGLSEDLSRENRLSQKHIQGVAFVRYNPYDEVGGDQSFSIALLDSLGDGIVVTSLHTRSGTRVFAKPVSKGEENGYEFSKEEREVITKK